MDLSLINISKITACVGIKLVLLSLHWKLLIWEHTLAYGKYNIYISS